MLFLILFAEIENLRGKLSIMKTDLKESHSSVNLESNN